MARIVWLGRYLGREQGDIENVEVDTDFMQALLRNDRFAILPDEEPEAEEAPEVEQPVVVDVVEDPKPKSRRKPATFESEVEAAVAQGDTEE